ncbi:MAG: hypothetical protein AAF502_01100 [Bacteroidota bacterium]
MTIPRIKIIYPPGLLRLITVTGICLVIATLAMANSADSLFLEITAKVEASPVEGEGQPVILYQGEIFPEIRDDNVGKIILYGDKELRLPFQNKEKATSYKKLYESDTANYKLILEDFRFFIETYNELEKLEMVTKVSDTEFKVDVSSLKLEIGRDKTVLLANRLDKEALTLQKESIGTIKMSTVGNYFRLIAPGYPSIVYTPSDIEKIKTRIVEPPEEAQPEEENLQPETPENEEKADKKGAFWPYLLLFLALLSFGVYAWYRKGRPNLASITSKQKTDPNMSNKHQSNKGTRSSSADMPSFEEFNKLIRKLEQQENRAIQLNEKVERIESSTQNILDQIKSQKSGDDSTERFQIKIEELEKENKELKAVAEAAATAKPEGMIFWDGYKEFASWDSYLSETRKIEEEVIAFASKVQNKSPESAEAHWLNIFLSKFLGKKPAEAIGKWQSSFGIMKDNDGLVLDKEARKRLKSGSSEQQMQAMNKLFFDQVLNPYISSLLIFVEETRKLGSFVDLSDDLAKEAAAFNKQFSTLFNQTASRGIEPMKVELFEKTFDIKGEFKMASIEELSPTYRKLRDKAPKQTVLEILSYGFKYDNIFNQESRIIEA